ncbi:Retrotransposon, unclassified-like protein [Dorcoceras hygrometricum]|uniref:Retrotransposon, unclassified-like protein n=1 Tax=Dorcoceras hygrometricum TaxID=472368 RepID=A0A2Z7AFF5_9LAMI|nr:Retrotransposon, unclassified-like protein [Dorcoceras hygrometricum]
MIKIRHLAESHIRWSIGEGDISFWFDAWLPTGPLASICEIIGPKDWIVSWFLEQGSWQKERLLLHLDSNIVDQVLQIPVSPYANDMLIWTLTSNGRFNSRSSWESLRQRRPLNDIYTACWSKILSPTISLFAWHWVQCKLPTDDITKRRGISLASKCQFCDQEESFEHLFFSSSIADQAWTYFGQLFGISQPHQISNWKISTTWRPRGHLRECVPFLIMWFIWTARNDSKHREIKLRPAAIIRNIRYYISTAYTAGLIQAEH